MFPHASPPDILRSIQRDEFYLLDLRKKVFDIFQSFLGQQRLAKWDQSIKIGSDFIYYLATTLAGSQTLGEEYADITTVHHLVKPSLKRRAMLVFLLVFSPLMIRKSLHWLHKRAEQSKNSDGNVERVAYLKKLVGPILSLQLAYFYFTGSFYHVSHMLTNTKYVLLRKFRQGESSGGYEILGLLILIQLLVSNFSKTQIENADYDDSMAIEVETMEKCTLCLGPRKDSTAASCGHVFCWKCISDWIRTKPECALCRQSITAQGLIPLHNY